MLDLHNPYTRLLQDTPIVVPQPALVQDYLTRHPDLVDIVAQIGRRLQQEFGDTMQIALHWDMKTDENDEELTYYLRAEEYDGNLMERIYPLDEEYGPLQADKSGWLHVTTDYQPPLQPLRRLEGGSFMLDVQTPYDTLLQDVPIVVPQPAAVQSYLNRHPDMVDIVAQMGQRLQQEFGDTMQVALEFYRDPEADDEYLTYSLRAEKYEDDVMDRIDAVSDEYDSDLANKSGWLLVTTDFYPPLI